ncbi:uncharacterized protein LOC120674544 [Panicum virgatum]|uniref:uncharacterized protein LOC120674544 n=1 Tax=Panicum virgatum TaxID=38727 RepID=UPI0019D661FF|nr:uncharacterized protein LOC120674544 [Panicum virgatum]
MPGCLPATAYSTEMQFMISLSEYAPANKYCTLAQAKTTQFSRAQEQSWCVVFVRARCSRARTSGAAGRHAEDSAPAQADRAAAFAHAGAPATSVLLIVAVVVAAAAAVVVSLCTGSKNARPRKQRRSSLAPAPQEQQDSGGGRSKPQLLVSLSGIGVKAAAVAKMVSWNRRSPPASGGWRSNDDDDVAAGEEEALWKKTIIMGGKCRPLESSGHVAYDSDGNPLQPPVKDAAAEA